MKTLYLFAYGGKSQNRGRALGSEVLQRIKRIARCIENHPHVHYTVLFAAGRHSFTTDEKPLRELMKKQLVRELTRLRDKKIPFMEPDIVLIKCEKCSVKEETLALSAYVRGLNVAECSIAFSFPFNQLCRVIQHAHYIFPHAAPHLLLAWLLPGIAYVKMTFALSEEKQLVPTDNQELVMGS